MLFIEYRKRNQHKIIHSCAKLLASDSAIDEAYKSMHQSITRKIKNYVCQDWMSWM